jgi:hypothetical protein
VLGKGSNGVTYRILGPLQRNPVAISVTSAGSIVVSGSYASKSITFESSTLTNYNKGYSDAFVVQLTSTGAEEWSNSYGGMSNEYILSHTVDASDNVYLIGTYVSGNLDVDSTTLSNLVSDESSSDVFLIKLTSTGTVSWAVGWGGSLDDTGNGVAVDSAGNVYVTESFYSATMDLGSITLTRVTQSDIYIAKLSSTGSYFTWAKSWIGATPSSKNFGQGIALDSTGTYLYQSGTFSDVAIKLGSVYVVPKSGTAQTTAFAALYYPANGTARVAYAWGDDGMSNVEIVGPSPWLQGGGR